MKKVKTNIESANGVLNAAGQQRMTSLEIAEVTGKSHAHLMRDIRNMERAWEKVTESRFGLSSYKDATGRTLPCYLLTKTECLYVATKFNDEARARLVLRWEELELAARERELAAMGGARPLVDLSGSHGSQASVVIILGADGKALRLTPEVMAGLLRPGTGLLTSVAGRLLPAEWHPYHVPVRALVARTANGIVREGTDDYTLYMRVQKAYLEALGVSKETFFEAEFQKLMVQCAMED